MLYSEVYIVNEIYNIYYGINMKVILIIGILILLNGCWAKTVKPWQKGNLAKPEMALDSTPLTSALNDHVYFSKEASSGGRSFSGGGCGCN